MYPSDTARAQGIALGAELSRAELLVWLHRSAEKLDAAMTAMNDRQWERLVVTAQGRTVPASATLWMRAREVLVHTVDLSSGVTFEDLPEDFLLALRTEILTRRGEVPAVTGPPAQITAYLAGRPFTGVTTPDGRTTPALGPWL